MDIIDSIKEGKCSISIDERRPHKTLHETVFPTEWEYGSKYDKRKMLGFQTLWHRCGYCKTRMFEVNIEKRRIVVGKNEQVFTHTKSDFRWGWYCKTCGHLQEGEFSFP